MASTVCAQHPDLAARETCGRCGRPVCLDCATPVRGAVRCPRCVREEIGDPIPDAAPHGRRVDAAAGALFLAAVAVSILPWGSDRSGLFSAWVSGTDPWPLATIVLVAVAAALSLRRRGGRRSTLHVIVGGAGVLVGLLALPAPHLATRTLVPVLVVGLAALATGLAAARLLARRGGPPQPP